MIRTIDLRILPRESMSWDEFVKKTPRGSIALDGVVLGGPKYDEDTLHVNFDHHDGVAREATMSTARQVMFAIKGNLMKSLFWQTGLAKIPVYVNDPDQDVALSVWLLDRHKSLEGTQSIPIVNRLLELTDKLDITGGGYPMNLDDGLLSTHNWIFAPYNDLRKSGALASANEAVICSTLESMTGRIDQLVMGQAEKRELDTRHEILYDSPSGFKIVNEIGGSEARYFLFSQGLDAYISLVAIRPDNRNVWTVGRRSPYIPFPINELFGVYNALEGLPEGEGWGGSNIVGGSSRKHGSGLSWEQLAEATVGHLQKKYGKNLEPSISV
ncbi:hypothetical protein COU60_03670 [Candidatus Pacearchaeota archaeon CG10_big_fil_rev_8_21_14_0_10_34_76]|nr:MAG: hypothetical protein COU60_03670 [Candidatus Pacearchaeota archaeon CG10_big_fil_rev_8_21_14_0_10_34_76]